MICQIGYYSVDSSEVSALRPLYSTNPYGDRYVTGTEIILKCGHVLAVTDKVPEQVHIILWGVNNEITRSSTSASR